MNNATLTKFADEADQFYLDCTLALAEDDTITGLVVMSYLPSGLSGGGVLTFGAPTVNTVTVIFPDGRSGKIGAVILVRISGGASLDGDTEREYTVIATFSTANGNTKTVRGRLLVLPLAL